MSEERKQEGTGKETETEAEKKVIMGTRDDGKHRSEQVNKEEGKRAGEKKKHEREVGGKKGEKMGGKKPK